MAGNSELARQPLQLIPVDLEVIYSVMTRHGGRIYKKRPDISRLNLKIFALRGH